MFTMDNFTDRIWKHDNLQLKLGVGGGEGLCTRRFGRLKIKFLSDII